MDSSVAPSQAAWCARRIAGWGPLDGAAVVLPRPQEAPAATGGPTPPYRDVVRAYERALVRDALDAIGGSWARAATRLGLR